MEFNFQLMQQLFKQQQNAEYTDCSFVFEVETEDGKCAEKVIHGHKPVFVAASEYFKTQFKKEWLHAGPIPISSVPYPVFEKLVQGIYLNEITFETLKDAIDLYESAHFYQVESVLDLLREKIPKFCCSEKLTAVSQLLNMAWKYHDFKLISFSTKYFTSNTDMIIKDEDFTNINQNIVNLLYQIDDLSVEEENLMKALEKYIEKHSDVSSYILRPAIGAIRFLSFAEQIIQETTLLTQPEKDYPLSFIYLSKRRNPRERKTPFELLPAEVQHELREKTSFNYCWLCKQTHHAYPCTEMKTRYKFYQNLKQINLYEKHMSEIKKILTGFDKLSRSDKHFSTFFNVIEEVNNIFLYR